LHWAVLTKNEVHGQQLLDLGTKVDTKSKEERTALDVAVFKDRKTVMRVLRAKKK